MRLMGARQDPENGVTEGRRKVMKETRPAYFHSDFWSETAVHICFQKQSVVWVGDIVKAWLEKQIESCFGTVVARLALPRGPALGLE
jgi:hypothetical protein